MMLLCVCVIRFRRVFFMYYFQFASYVHCCCYCSFCFYFSFCFCSNTMLIIFSINCSSNTCRAQNLDRVQMLLPAQESISTTRRRLQVGDTVEVRGARRRKDPTHHPCKIDDQRIQRPRRSRTGKICRRITALLTTPVGQ